VATRLLLPDRVERNVFHGTPHGTDRMVWDPEGCPLHAVGSAGAAADVTVNDVLELLGPRSADAR